MKLGDFISASGERNKSLRCTDVYSVTNSLGFTPSAEHFSKEVFSKDLKTYRVVRRGMIAYNPSRINVGSVALQDKRSEVIVSPLYVVFEVDESRLLPEFLLRFLKSKRGLEQIVSSSTGTVRNNLKFDALCGMEIRLPSLADQHGCVGGLKAISNQISALDLTLKRLDQLVKSRFVEMFESLLHLLSLKLLLVERANEHEIGELADNLNGVGDTAFPHLLPNGVDLALGCSGNHRLAPLLHKALVGTH